MEKDSENASTGSDPSPPEELTRILERAMEDDESARAQLFTLVYDELRRLAAGQMRGERGDHTLQPTALVHEAYLRLFGNEPALSTWNNRAHFFGAAAEVMRRILVDHARRHLAAKRGGGWSKTPLDKLLPEEPQRLVAIDEALNAFEAAHPQMAHLGSFVSSPG